VTFYREFPYFDCL